MVVKFLVSDMVLRPNKKIAAFRVTRPYPKFTGET